MTVAELIAKLQEMPQDMLVHRYDTTWDSVPMEGVSVEIVLEETRDKRGRLTDQYIRLEAVVLS
jgi:hypothetical protein